MCECRKYFKRHHCHVNRNHHKRDHFHGKKLKKVFVVKKVIKEFVVPVHHNNHHCKHRDHKYFY